MQGLAAFGNGQVGPMHVVAGAELSSGLPLLDPNGGNGAAGQRLLKTCTSVATEGAPCSGRALDHCDEFVAAVSVAACNLDQFLDLGKHGTVLRGAGNRDRAAAAHFDEAFVA